MPELKVPPVEKYVTGMSSFGVGTLSKSTTKLTAPIGPEFISSHGL